MLWFPEKPLKIFSMPSLFFLTTKKSLCIVLYHRNKCPGLKWVYYLYEKKRKYMEILFINEILNIPNPNEHSQDLKSNLIILLLYIIALFT